MPVLLCWCPLTGGQSLCQRVSSAVAGLWREFSTRSHRAKTVFYVVQSKRNPGRSGAQQFSTGYAFFRSFSGLHTLCRRRLDTLFLSFVYNYCPIKQLCPISGVGKVPVLYGFQPAWCANFGPSADCISFEHPVGISASRCWVLLSHHVGGDISIPRRRGISLCGRWGGFFPTSDSLLAGGD